MMAPVLHDNDTKRELQQLRASKRVVRDSETKTETGTEMLV